MGETVDLDSLVEDPRKAFDFAIEKMGLGNPLELGKDIDVSREIRGILELDDENRKYQSILVFTSKVYELTSGIKPESNQDWYEKPKEALKQFIKNYLITEE